MPDGDLASVVLEAARKERAKQDAEAAAGNVDDGRPPQQADLNSNKGSSSKGKGKARENGDILSSHQDSASSQSSTAHGNANGFLEAPTYHRAMTASPEPLTPQLSRDNNDENNDNNNQAQQNGSIPKPTPADAAPAASNGQTPSEHFKAPAAKNRPAVRAGPSARKLSSAFFGGGHGHGSNSNSASSSSAAKANKKQAAERKKYTSESSMDPDDGPSNYFGVSNHTPGEFSDFFVGHGHSPYPTHANGSATPSNAHRAAQDSSGDSKNNGPTATANGAGPSSGKPNTREALGKAMNHASPQAQLRGPFSRADSSRGQTLLTRKHSIGSQEAHERSHAQDPSQLRGSNLHRRYSVGGAAQRFSHALGVFGHPTEVEDEESADEESGAADGHHTPSQSRARTPLAGERSHSFWRGSSGDDNIPNGDSQHVDTGAARGVKGSTTSGASSARPQGVSRKSSYRSLNIFKRSQGPGDGQNGQTTDGDANIEGQRHPGLSRANTQPDGAGQLPPGIGKSRWNQLKQRLKQEKKPADLEMTLNGSELINDLSLGLMSVMMLKMAFDRDEHDQHRVGLYFNYASTGTS